MRLLFSFFLLCAFSLPSAVAQPATNANTTTFVPEWASLDKRPTPQWWLDAKFGIFIHWGVYSVPAYTPKGRYAEWYQHSLQDNDADGSLKRFHAANYGARTYYELAQDFHAEFFDADAWAQLFESAGAKYVVLTAKHHDGFCLWPSPQTSKIWGPGWNAGENGPRRDLVGEFVSALRRTDVKPGLYYSLFEWYNPLWHTDKSKYAAEHAMPQLTDLVSRYQPDIVWADGDWDVDPTVWKSREFLAWLYNDSNVRDRVVTNDRWGSGTRFKHGDFFTPEYQPEKGFDHHAWEESRGMGYSYGYNRAEDAWDYNSSQMLILHLIDKVARGGNFLLDIGPDAHGQIPPIMQERLLDIGQWLSVNGEAIYNTRQWRQHCQWSAGKRYEEGAKIEGDWLSKLTLDPDPGYAVKETYFTYNPQTRSTYAILPKYPADRKLTLRGVVLPANTEVTLLATRDKLRWENGKDGALVVYLPEYNPARMRAPEAFVVRLSNYGAYTDKPEIAVNYDPRTMQPTVNINHTAANAIIRYTIDGTEVNDKSPIYPGPFPLAKAAKVRAKAWRTGMLESGESMAEVKTYAYMPALTFIQQPQQGLAAQLLATVDDAPYNRENVEKGKIVAQGVVVNFALDPMCAEKCGMIWQGFINVSETTGYEFFANSDDGSQIYIDNQLIVNNDFDHGMEEKSGMAFLQRGWHAVKVIYFNSGGAAGLEVKYAPIGGTKQDLPAAMLGH